MSEARTDYMVPSRTSCTHAIALRNFGLGPESPVRVKLTLSLAWCTTVLRGRETGVPVQFYPGARQSGQFLVWSNTTYFCAQLEVIIQVTAFLSLCDLPGLPTDGVYASLDYWRQAS